MAAVDRHDLEALKEWAKSEFRVVDTAIQAIKDSTAIAAAEQEKRDDQLNDVRLRFIPREEFLAYRRFLTVLAVAVFAEALVIVGLLLT